MKEYETDKEESINYNSWTGAFLLVIIKGYVCSFYIGTSSIVLFPNSI